MKSFEWAMWCFDLNGVANNLPLVDRAAALCKEQVSWYWYAKAEINKSLAANSIYRD